LSVEGIVKRILVQRQCHRIQQGRRESVGKLSLTTLVVPGDRRAAPRLVEWKP